MLVLVKPDGVERALIGAVIGRFESAGLKVIGIKMLKATGEQVARHYTDDESWLVSVGTKTKKAYASKGIEVKESEREIGIRIRSLLMKELVRGPIVAMALQGNAATEVARKIAGATEPKSADPSTIRGAYASDTYALADSNGRPVRNIVHVSENAELSEKELAVWFSDDELFDYTRADERQMYG